MAGRTINLSFILLSSLLLVSAKDDGTEFKDFVQWFEEGATAYLDEHWQECLHAMQKSMADFKQYKSEVVLCRLRCKDEAEAAQPLSMIDVEDLGFFERQIRTTLCMMKCNEGTVHEKRGVYKEEVLKKFESLAPYDYLQLCYFQRNMLKQAADAAFTFLVANPHHTSMKKNFDFYLSLPEVDRNDITNLEAKKFVSLYVHGVDAYDKKNFEAVIQYFEESLADYMQNEKECRAYCEGPFDQGWFPEFVPSISNHFAYCLKCKSNCTYNLNSLNGERHTDLLPSHYHYLQFAYFKVGKLKEACEAAMSYLLFYPADEEMLENLKYYKSLPKARKEYFHPRQEAFEYIQRFQYEQKILNFISTEYNYKQAGNKKGDDGETISKQEEDNKVDEDESS
ncbi:prolyl 3-hydroxylase 1-like [Neocloeon triangulifer]|uniref:prolyl 3-hydroxylase 1-like n=1 Tax=Neocloeon triangulifer TaxID=2078957 RepID=UPI00286F5C57|nr:prolyl 3-hydroxylase 1-like [Neocloeon triangulifer]